MSQTPSKESREMREESSPAGSTSRTLARPPSSPSVHSQNGLIHGEGVAGTQRRLALQGVAVSYQAIENFLRRGGKLK